MPLIEELPVTSTIRPSHGWAYVPDFGQPIAAVQPGNRKRGAAREANQPSFASINAKQEKAVQQRLKELEKENYKDVPIPIPKRDESGLTYRRGADKKKMARTQNVRRILGYSRNFGHYLADEEASVAAGGGGIAAILAPGPAVANVSTTAATTSTAALIVDSEHKVDGRKKRGAAVTTATAPITSTPTKTAAMIKRERANTATATATSPNSKDVEMKDASPSSTSPSKSKTTVGAATTATPMPASKPNLPINPILDKDPLLRTRDIPKPPSDRVMQTLLAELPLSYNAARAKLPSSLANMDNEAGTAMSSGTGGVMQKPRRYFCSICGYFGKIRCKRCGERTCGILECVRGHEGVCTGAVGY